MLRSCMHLLHIDTGVYWVLTGALAVYARGQATCMQPKGSLQDWGIVYWCTTTILLVLDQRFAKSPKGFCMYCQVVYTAITSKSHLLLEAASWD